MKRNVLITVASLVLMVTGTACYWMYDCKQVRQSDYVDILFISTDRDTYRLGDTITATFQLKNNHRYPVEVECRTGAGVTYYTQDNPPPHVEPSYETTPSELSFILQPGETCEIHDQIDILCTRDIIGDYMIKIEVCHPSGPTAKVETVTVTE